MPVILLFFFIYFFTIEIFQFLKPFQKKYQQLIYVSETFEKTTGYAAKDIIGKNCRFLQAPDGKVKAGSVRQHSDNNVISHMKSCVDSRQECQFSLVNYKKSGEPFINLVTIIPV